MLAPVVRNAFREGNHPLDDGELAFKSPLCVARRLGGFGLQSLDKSTAGFRHQLNGIGREQLIVAKRRRYGARIGVDFKAGLDIVSAVARSLKSVDAHGLVFAQAGRRGHFRIGPLEFEFIRRPLRHEVELLLGGGEKIGDDRHIGSRRLFLRRFGIYRSRRTGIFRRLCQDIIVEGDRLAVRAL